VSTIVEDNAMELHKEMKICANKQSAVRSATEQAADLANVFKDQHAVQRMTTVENVDASNCPIKKRVVQGFQEMSNKGLRLNLTRKDALVDFLSCLPDRLTKTSARSKIVHGFACNELVGDEAKHASKFAFPDFDIMLDTVHRKVSKEECNLCKQTFRELLLCGLKLGEVEEQEHNKLGCPMDKAPCGQEISKDKITTKQEC